MNSKYAVVPLGSRAVVLSEGYDYSIDRNKIQFCTVPDLRLLYKNKLVEIGRSARGEPKYQNYADYWLEHPDRREYDGIGFFPEHCPTGYYNLFKGFPVPPVPGDCSLFLWHIKNVICRGDDDFYAYVVGWMAHLIQKPSELPEVALVILGKQGTGKTTFVESLGALVGEHFITVNGTKQLTGSFNGHLSNMLLVNANEATWGGDKVGEGALKALITDEFAPVEYKFRDVITERNYKRLILTSNETWPVGIGIDDRRYFVVEVSDMYKENKAYFAKLKAFMASGGLSALMHHLMTLDISDFDVRTPPYSRAAFDIKLKSSDHLYTFLYELLACQIQPEHQLNWSEYIEISHFYDGYYSWCTAANVNHLHSKKALHTHLKQIFPNLESAKATKKSESGDRPRVYRFSDRDHARHQFQLSTKSGPEIWDI